MITFFFITVMALASGVRMETCPPEEDISPCWCSSYPDSIGEWAKRGDLQVSCYVRADVGDLKRVMSSLSGKKNVHLTLYGLSLGRVPSDLFSGVGIKTLQIDNCAINTLAEGGPAFQGLEDTLEQLTISRSLAGDKISAELGLGRLQRLTFLTLSDNNITELGDDFFEDAPTSLKGFAITDDIERIGSNVFTRLVNLEYLALFGVRRIQRSMLPNPAYNLKSLQIISPNGNQEAELSEDTFDDLPALRFVQIQDFGIETLDERVWSPVWQQLETVLLLHNPIRCDDHLSWLFRLRGPQLPLTKCYSPEEQSGKSLQDFINSRRQ